MDEIGSYPPEGGNKLLTVQLLKLTDVTGDGVVNEIVIKNYLGVCGFFDGLVVGIDPGNGRLRLYSDWIFRFEPNNKGLASSIIECGDHGSRVRERKEYAYDKVGQKFIQTKETSEKCQ